MRLGFALFAVALAGIARAETIVEFKADGTLAVPSVDISLEVTEYLKHWNGQVCQSYDKYQFPKDGSLDWTMRRAEKVYSVGRTELKAEGKTAAFRFEVSPKFARDSECLVLASRLPTEKFAGGRWSLDDGAKSGAFPQKLGKMLLVWSKARSVTLTPRSGNPLRIEFPEPTVVMIQDDRKWGPSFTMRVGCDQKVVAKDELLVFAGRIVTKDGTRVVGAEPVVISEGEDWVRLDYRKDIVPGSALDLSGQGLQDAPAGKYGWLKNVGGHFEFERKPGEPQRFYGVNLCFTANYPDHHAADLLIDRLKRSGYNSLRIHHYDGGFITGRPAEEIAINADNAERLDYLLAKAIENGLYITTDIFVSRPVTWRQIGLEDCGKGEIRNKNVYKALVALWEPAFKDWCVFAERLLTHVNPYTGRSYLNEPALPLISLINEGQLTMGWTATRQQRVVREAWKAWLAERRRADPTFFPDAPEDCIQVNAYGRHKELMSQFMADTERKSAARMIAFLRKLGSRALFTNANCGPHYPPMQAVREELYDYVDDHFYVDHPHFLCRKWQLPSQCGNGNPVLNAKLYVSNPPFVRLADKPFTITEWNFSGPGRFRGVGGIMTGAFAAQQDWDGLWRFAYAHDRRLFADNGGFPSYFDLSTDPLGMASDRASICLFLRKDMKAGVDSAAYSLDRDRGAFKMVTPRTAGGFTPEGKIECGPVSFAVRGVPATVWASSVDREPTDIRQAKRLLVTHLTDVQAAGNVYADQDKTILFKWGHNPPLVRNGSAEIALALASPKRYEVWSLGTTGERLERIASEVRSGKLCFTAAVRGSRGARMLYEVVDTNRQ